jgi:cell division protein ZapA
MREVRGASRMQSVDRIAVLAALNMAHELLQAKNNSESQSNVVAQQLQALRAKLDAALAPRLK